MSMTAASKRDIACEGVLLAAMAEMIKIINYIYKNKYHIPAKMRCLRGMSSITASITMSAFCTTRK